MIKRLILVLILVLAAQGSLLANSEDEITWISGIVVTKDNKPIPYAVVVHTIAELDGETLLSVLMEDETADENGRFTIGFPNKSGKIRIWATIKPKGYFIFPLVYDKRTIGAGNLIDIPKNVSKVDIGKIPINLQLGNIKLNFDRRKPPPRFTLVKWEILDLRIRSFNGDVVSETGRSPIIENGIFWYNFAFPFGTWSIDILNDQNEWETLLKPTTISKENPNKVVEYSPQNTDSLSSPKIKRLLKLDRDSALKELKNLGYEFTKTEFHDRLWMGNLEAVIIFVRAGMDPNVKFDVNYVPLMMARPFKLIVKFLLLEGANPNVKIAKLTEFERERLKIPYPEDATPLILAAQDKEIEVVKLLIEHGATVNDIDSEGNSALTMAVEVCSPDLVKLLLKHSADIKTNKYSVNGLIEKAKECDEYSEISKTLKMSQKK